MTTIDTRSSRHGFSTRQVHAGERFEGSSARITPVHQSAGYLFDSFDHTADRFSGEDPGFIYSRVSNPTNLVVEERLASLEGGSGALLTGSGQAAMTIALLSLLGAGDHVISSLNIYEGTRSLLRRTFGRMGIECDFVTEPNDPDAWRRLVRPTTRAFFGEPVSNPTNRLLDVATVAQVAEDAGVPLVLDNTLTTPYLFRPVEHGAHVVAHSTSKFLSGHGSVIGGAIVDGGTFDWDARPELTPQFDLPYHPDGRTFRDKFADRVYWGYTRLRPAADIGPSYSAQQAFLLLHGLETLSLRMERHSTNALATARWLERQPEVSAVHHLGLESHAHHELALKYLPNGQSAVFSFEFAGGREQARTFIDALELFSRMTHIGDVRSLVLHPATTTHLRLAQEDRDALGVTEGMVRLSVGIEDVDDLIADLERAFDRVRQATA